MFLRAVYDNLDYYILDYPPFVFPIQRDEILCVLSYDRGVIKVLTARGTTELSANALRDGACEIACRDFSDHFSNTIAHLIEEINVINVKFKCGGE